MDQTTGHATSLAGALSHATRRLAEAGIENAAADARLIARRALGVGAETLVRDRDRVLSQDERLRLNALVARRAAREPVSRILAMREFWSLEFALSPACLDPRPDSEIVVEVVLADLDARGGRARPWRVLDLGTGSGCLFLALLSELPNAKGVGIDASAETLTNARGNARRLGLADRCTFVLGDWAKSLTGPFDAIVANPPYIESAAIPGLPPEVRDWDPRAALDGGSDGLDAYRAILPDLPRLMGRGALAAFEIGQNQAARVMALACAAGLAPAGVRHDLAGRDRCLLLRGPPAAI